MENPQQQKGAARAVRAWQMNSVIMLCGGVFILLALVLAAFNNSAKVVKTAQQQEQDMTRAGHYVYQVTHELEHGIICTPAQMIEIADQSVHSQRNPIYILNERFAGNVPRPGHFFHVSPDPKTGKIIADIESTIPRR
jgi:hypothetical protein